jgi:nucleotide-binding universal stress UspA family protein
VSTPYRGSSLAAGSPKLERILVATDLGPGRDALLEAAAMVARAAAAKLHVLCVLEALMYSPPEMRALADSDRETHPEATHKLAEVVARLRALGVQDVDGDLEFGIALDVVVEKANAGRFDLLIVGSRGRGFFASQALTRSTIPVLVVPLPS